MSVERGVFRVAWPGRGPGERWAALPPGAVAALQHHGPPGDCPARARAWSRLRCMSSTPNARSASYWLCARHRRRRPRIVVAPPRAKGTTWSYSRARVALQRRPAPLVNVQRPASRVHTARRTCAGIVRVRLPGARGAVLRGRAVAPGLPLEEFAPKLLERAPEHRAHVARTDRMAEQALHLAEQRVRVLVDRDLDEIGRGGGGSRGRRRFRRVRIHCPRGQCACREEGIDGGRGPFGALRRRRPGRDHAHPRPRRRGRARGRRSEVPGEPRFDLRLRAMDRPGDEGIDVRIRQVRRQQAHGRQVEPPRGDVVEEGGEATRGARRMDALVRRAVGQVQHLHAVVVHRGACLGQVQPARIELGDVSEHDRGGGALVGDGPGKLATKRRVIEGRESVRVHVRSRFGGEFDGGDATGAA